MLSNALRAHLRSARELAPRPEEPPRPPLCTALRPFDRLLVGGLPRGQLVELIGRRSSGRFSIALSALAAASGGGEAAALVDLGRGLDPQLAAAAGVALEHLLWIQPGNLKQALHSAEMLLDGGFPLVVLDLGCPPVPGRRGGEAPWVRLARAASAHGAALLVSSPYRISGTAAAAVVKASRPRPVWSAGSPPLLTSLCSRLTLEKLRGSTAGKTGLLRLAAPDGIPPPRSGPADGRP